MRYVGLFLLGSMLALMIPLDSLVDLFQTFRKSGRPQ